MPSTIAPIELTRSNSIRPLSGLRYGNFEGVIHLPPVNVSGRNDFSSLNNQQIYKTVCEWFETWRPWQQRICLCGIANRCTAHQLDILATTLEPVRHRDYSTASNQRYPSASFRRVQEIHRIHLDSLPKTKQPRKKKAKSQGGTAKSEKKQLTIPTSQSERKSRKQSRANSKLSSVSFAEDVKHDVKKQDIEKTSHDVSVYLFADQLATGILASAVHEAAAVLDIEKKEFSKRKSVQEKEKERHTETHEHDEENVEKALSENEFEVKNVDDESEDLEEKYQDVESIDSDVENNEVFREEGSDLYDATSQQGELSGSGRSLQPASREKSILKKYTRQKGHSKFPGKVIQLRSNSVKSSRSGGARTSSSQFRRSVFGSSAVSTLEFFSPRQTIGGVLQREIRQGPVQKPAGLADIPVPLVRSYKSIRWWPATPEAGHIFKKAKKRDLSGSYREQLAQIWEWLSLWEDFERIALLREVVKVCSASILEYLVSHISQKIREDTDINRLMDRTLLYIFSYLTPHEINIASQVCRRWRFLCATDDLWMVKCLEMGESEGVENITGLVLAAKNPGGSVDWKLAYLELKHLVHTMKQGLAVPQELQFGDDESASKNGDGKTDMKRGHKAPKVKLGVGMPVRSKRREIIGCSRCSEDDSDDSSVEEDLSEYMAEYALQTEPQPQSIHFTTKYAYQNHYRRISRVQKKVKDSDKDGKDASLEESNKKEDDQKESSVLGRKHAEEGEDEEENAILDVRPTLQTSVDVLGKIVPGVSLEWQTASPDSDPILNTRTRKYAGSVVDVKKARKLQGHMSGIMCLQFDKRRLVTGGQDRSIRVWDIRSGRSLHKFYGPKGGVRCLQFDDDILVTGSWDMLVMVWDMHQFTFKTSLSGHKGCVSCVKFNQDYIVSASHDGTVRTWYRRGLCNLNVLTLHRGSINALCLDGMHIITAASDMKVKMTHMLTGQTVLQFQSIHSQIIALNLQDCLLIGSDHTGTVYFWNKINGETEAGVKAHGAPIYKITYHQGRIWTASGDHTVKEWDLSTMTCVRALQGHKGPVRDIKVSAERAVTCSDDGTIRIWDFVLPKTSQKQSA